MKRDEKNNEVASDIITLALSEDIGSGDVTTHWFIPRERRASAKIIAKQSCCVAGTSIAAEVFARVDANLIIELLHEDGSHLNPGDTVLIVKGSAASILTAERTALNFIQHLSGIATLTRSYVNAVAGTGARILDTRKTTPGMRLLEKAAVTAGDATNHRAGLYDMVMVKDNHLASGITMDTLQSAINSTKAANPKIRIEIEAETVAQAKAFFQLQGIDIVLLDNMSLESLKEVVQCRPPHIQLEASGGVTLDTVRAIAETGVDFISIGALTHSAPAIDFSLEIEAVI